MSNQNNNRMNNVDMEGVTGGVFSFPLMSLFGNNNNNGSGNEDSGTNNTNNNQTPQPTFTNLADIIGTAINSTMNPAENNDNNNNTNNNTNNTNNNHGPRLTNGLSNFIQNIVEDFATNLSTRPPKRHFSKEALKLLKPLKLSELPKSEEKCPICYDPFDEYEPESTTNNSSNSTTNNTSSHISESAKYAESIANLHLPEFLKDYDPEDPSISFPSDETAAYQNSYTLNSEPSLISQIPPPRSSSSSNTDHGHNSNGEHHHPDLDDNDLHYAVQLPQCDHIFGRSCIIEWLKSNVSCPLCRREIVPELTETDQNNRRNSNRIVYDTALTETFVPVDWTGPISSGYVLNDPSVSFPIRSHGISIGRRTGVPPDSVNNNDVNNNDNDVNTFDNENDEGEIIDVEVEIHPISNTHSDVPVNDLLNDLD